MEKKNHRRKLSLSLAIPMHKCKCKYACINKLNESGISSMIQNLIYVNHSRNNHHVNNTCSIHRVKTHFRSCFFAWVFVNSSKLWSRTNLYAFNDLKSIHLQVCDFQICICNELNYLYESFSYYCLFIIYSTHDGDYCQWPKQLNKQLTKYGNDVCCLTNANTWTFSW